MENYTWNVKEIREKLKYAKERLKRETDTKDREILMHSLLTYINLLHTTDIKNLKFANLMNKLTQGRFSLIRDKKYKEISDIVFDFKDYVYDDDLLINLSQNIKNNSFQAKEAPLAILKLSPQELIEISKGFYKWLGDKEIYNYASEMLDNKSHLQFKNLKYQKNGFGITSGITYYDPLFEEAYIGITQEFTLFDAQVFNHEIMHSIDFKMHQKLPSNNYYGFHEVSTYTIDYLFFDYLEEKGYDLTEINKLKYRKIEYINRLASYSLLRLQLYNGNKFSFQNVSTGNLKKSVVAWSAFFFGEDKSKHTAAVNYMMLTIAFAVGAIISALLQKLLVLKTIWIAVIFLTTINLVYIIALRRNKKIDFSK